MRSSCLKYRSLGILNKSSMSEKYTVLSLEINGLWKFYVGHQLEKIYCPAAEIYGPGAQYIRSWINGPFGQRPIFITVFLRTVDFGSHHKNSLKFKIQFEPNSNSLFLSLQDKNLFHLVSKVLYSRVARVNIFNSYRGNDHISTAVRPKNTTKLPNRYLYPKFSRNLIPEIWKFTWLTCITSFRIIRNHSESFGTW